MSKYVKINCSKELNGGMNMKKDIWNQWSGIHEEPDQLKRQNSAKSSKCTPQLIDKTECVGKFEGSSGHHTTTLESCSCIDFNRRKKPCKHMYRLAFELGIMNSDYKTNPNDIVRFHSGDNSIKISEAVDVIETLSNDEKELLLSVLYDMKYNTHSEFSAVEKDDPNLTMLLKNNILEIVDNNFAILDSYPRNKLKERIIETVPDIKFNKNMKRELLVEWVQNNLQKYISKICSDRVAVAVQEKFLKSKHKMYLYLNRISNIQSNDPFYSLPDDEVTSLIVKNGYANADNISNNIEIVISPETN